MELWKIRSGQNKEAEKGEEREREIEQSENVS